MITSFGAIAVVLAAEGKSGLPQLNPNDFAPQLIWLVITFVLLFVLLSKVALPRIGGVIEERAQRIQRDLDEAERLKLETEKALANYETSLAAARQRAGTMAKDLRDKLTAETDAERNRVETAITAKITSAETRITEMRTRALSEVGDIAVETAEMLVTQLSGTAAPADEVRRAVRAVAGE